ncbi:SDR family NAD(P)-dependent oxidoreductase, partial [Streptomyces johnsoniae]
NEDPGALADTLQIDDERLREVLPALSTWRRRHREQSHADSYRYQAVWRQVSESDAAVLSGTWLVVTPVGVGDEDAASLLRALSDRGATPERLDVTLEDVNRAKLDLRLDEIVGAGADLSGVVCLWPIDDTPHPDLPGHNVGSAGTLALVQALHGLRIEAPLWVLTRGAVTTTGSDHLTSPEQAQVWGWGRVAALELPSHWGGLIDVPERLDGRALRRLCQALGDPNGEDQLAIRPAGLLARRIVRAPLSHRTPSRRWTPRGTVLVTGGTGSIGSHLARWVARNGAEHVVLISRSGRNALGAPQLEAALTELGARVTIAACDVTDREALTALVRQVEAEGPPVRAVLHTAAYTELETLADIEPASFAEVCRAKVLGAQHLDELFDQDTLDAFVLFSAIASFWGSGEHGAYAAANAQLDALAEARRARGRTATSVSWGVWDAANDWDERNSEIRALKSEKSGRHGLPLLETGLAFSALQQSLDHDETMVAIADVDWEQFTTLFTMARPSRLISEIPEAQQALTGPAPAGEPGEQGQLAHRLAGATRAEQEHLLLDLVRSQAAQVLGHGASGEAIETDRTFRDMGFDSLTAVELRNRLNTVTGLRLPATLVFDHPNAVALAVGLCGQLVPDQDAEEQAVLDQLAQLESALSALSPDSESRAQVAKRLRNLLWSWDEAKPGDAQPGGEDVGEIDIASASADELFGLIDKRLGRS